MAARVSAQSLRPELAAAMATLDRRDRDVVRLVALAGLSHEEVAAALGIPYGTVGSRLSRARKKLRVALGALAVGAALAIVLAVLPGPPAPAAPDGRGILLAAATSAAGAAPATGPYWHVKRQVDGKVTELWATPDGRAWKDSEPVKRAPFSMAGKDLTFAQIQRLPTDPKALKAWVAGMVPGDAVMADAVAGLLWSKPSPPAVRASAYRVLADLPSVRYLGKRQDPTGRTGDAFAYDDRVLIIDPGTSQVLAATDAAIDGGETEVVLEAGFTTHR